MDNQASNEIRKDTLDTMNLHLQIGGAGIHSPVDKHVLNSDPTSL